MDMPGSKKATGLSPFPSAREARVGLANQPAGAPLKSLHLFVLGRLAGLETASTEELVNVASVQVRYIVDDVDAAIAFYCEHLGFHEDMHPAPTFAMLSRGELRLVLSAPNQAPGGGQSMPDGTMPAPGGWNRFAIEVADL